MMYFPSIIEKRFTKHLSCLNPRGQHLVEILKDVVKHILSKNTILKLPSLDQNALLLS